MRYAIYFTWKDGFKDSFNVKSAEERKFNIEEMLLRNEFSYIAYCPIYANGEYGKRTKVIGWDEEGKKRW